jgi:hypothetical protein
MLLFRLIILPLLVCGIEVAAQNMHHAPMIWQHTKLQVTPTPNAAQQICAMGHTQLQPVSFWLLE